MDSWDGGAEVCRPSLRAIVKLEVSNRRKKVEGHMSGHMSTLYGRWDSPRLGPPDESWGGSCSGAPHAIVLDLVSG